MKRNVVSIALLLLAFLLLFSGCEALNAAMDGLCEVRITTTNGKSLVGAIENNLFEDISHYTLFYKATPENNLASAYGMTEGFVYAGNHTICLSQGLWTIDVLLLPNADAQAYLENGISEEQKASLPVESYYEASSGIASINLNTTHLPVYVNGGRTGYGTVDFFAYLTEITEAEEKFDFRVTLYQLGDTGFAIYNLDGTNLVSGDSSLKLSTNTYVYSNGVFNQYESRPTFQKEGAVLHASGTLLEDGKGNAITKEFPIPMSDQSVSDSRYFDGFEKRYAVPAGYYVARITVRDYKEATNAESSKQILFKDTVGFKVAAGYDTIVYGLCDKVDAGTADAIRWLPDPVDNSSKLYLGEALTADLSTLLGETLKDETVYVMEGTEGASYVVSSTTIQGPEENTAVAFDLNGKHMVSDAAGEEAMMVLENGILNLYTYLCRAEQLGSTCSNCTACHTDCSDCENCTVYWGLHTSELEGTASTTYRTQSVISLNGGILAANGVNCDTLEIHGTTKEFLSYNGRANHVKLGAINFDGGDGTSSSYSKGGTIELKGNVKVTGVKGISSISTWMATTSQTPENPATSLSSDGYAIDITLGSGATILATGDGNCGGTYSTSKIYNDLAAGIYLVGRNTENEGTINITLKSGALIQATGEGYTEQTTKNNAKAIHEKSSFGIFIEDMQGTINITVEDGASIETDGYPIYLKNCNGAINIDYAGSWNTTEGSGIVFDSCTLGDNVTLTIRETAVTTEAGSDLYFYNSKGILNVQGGRTDVTSSAAFEGKTFPEPGFILNTEGTLGTGEGLIVKNTSFASGLDTIYLKSCSGTFLLNVKTLVSYQKDAFHAYGCSNLTLKMENGTRGGRDSKTKVLSGSYIIAGTHAFNFEKGTGKLIVSVKNKYLEASQYNSMGCGINIGVSSYTDPNANANTTTNGITMTFDNVYMDITANKSMGNALLMTGDNKSALFPASFTFTNSSLKAGQYAAIKFDKALASTLSVTLDKTYVKANGSFPIYFGNGAGRTSLITFNVLNGSTIDMGNGDRYAVYFYMPNSVSMTVDKSTIRTYSADAIYLYNCSDKKATFSVDIKNNSLISTYENGQRGSISNSGNAAIGVVGCSANAVTVTVDNSTIKSPFSGIGFKDNKSIGTATVTVKNGAIFQSCSEYAMRFTSSTISQLNVTIPVDSTLPNFNGNTNCLIDSKVSSYTISDKLTVVTE